MLAEEGVFLSVAHALSTFSAMDLAGGYGTAK